MTDHTPKSASHRGAHLADLPVRLHGESGVRDGHTLLLGPDDGFVACDPIFEVGDRVELEVLLDPEHDAGIHLIGHVVESVHTDEGGTPGVDLVWDDAIARDGALVLKQFLSQILGTDDLTVDHEGPPGFEWHHHFVQEDAAPAADEPPDPLEAMRRRKPGHHAVRRAVGGPAERIEPPLAVAPREPVAAPGRPTAAPPRSSSCRRRSRSRSRSCRRRSPPRSRSCRRRSRSRSRSRSCPVSAARR